MSAPAPIRLLVGSDGWHAVRLEALRSAAEEWVQIREDERTPGRMYEELRSYSFFGMGRTVCIERVDKLLKDEAGELREALAALAPQVQVVLTAGATKAGQDWAKELNGRADAAVEEEGGGRGGSVRAAMPEAKIDAELAALLDELYADQPLKLRRELEKLALFRPGQTIDAASWRELSVDVGAVDGWRFARAVMSRDLAAAEQILRDWVAAGGGGHSAGRDLLGAMGYVLRQVLVYRLLVATGTPAAQAARQTPGRFGHEDEARARQWSIPQLANGLSALVELDRNLKSTRVPAELQLLRWCLRTMDQEAA